jgi:uncharacterized protein
MKLVALFVSITRQAQLLGFAVLQYDKRGIGANFTILDSNVWGMQLLTI